MLAGVMNSFAGGGSFISFPALLVSGIEPIAANATNTCALWPGTIASTVAYRKAFDSQARRILPPLIVLGIVGGVLGANILLRTPQETFVKLIPWLLLLATIVFIFSARITSWLRARVENREIDAAPLGAAASGKRTPLLVFIGGLIIELFIATYIGYFGAGAGILVLALLALLGMENIHTMNGVKTLLVTIVNGVALVTFIVGHRIVWPEAAVMVVGAALGGYGGALFAQKLNPRHVRWGVIAIGFGMSAYFFVRYR
ncbi:MAG: sulfite exporter TauE/SafE family protein [Acidobacteriota bacterium]|nr:sulfite exporter TauE/SafE family protein [Acidobacteriota bacterium]MDE3169086.1 sulfite exporter TauE/SafE family protein [Acidobacteriota bacterium]